ncbi:transcription initiation factor IIB [Imshaugia aleurites]|uniref:Transcription initiation factor IIB n=1 Tax=Imshaugia aleurites TaxID=172621 RepID=A0A8H3FXR3_9LECA|nr:transcription initiation factor IIB [Imshaugia aleurites]
MASVAISETDVLNNSPFERIHSPNVGDAIFVSHGLPEDLRAAYKEIKALCDTMDTGLDIQSYAGELYEMVYASGELVSEAQKTIVAGCLFIAYGVTDRDQRFRERKISYHERCKLAPAMDLEVLRVFAALENFFEFKAPTAFVRDGDEAMDQTSFNRAKGREAAAMENDNANDANSIVDDSTKLLLEADKRVKTFCQCLPIPTQRLGHVTAHSRSLYEKINLSGGLEQGEQTAVLAGCFYLALRHLETPCTFRQIWILTRVPIEEVKAVVKHLEQFFAEETCNVKKSL